MVSEAFTSKYYHSTVTNETPLGLSLLISNDSFCYAIFNNSFTQLLELCHVDLKDYKLPSFDLSTEVQQLIKNYLLDRKKFEKVFISVLNNQYSLVPEAFVAEGGTKPYLQFTSGVSDIKTSQQLRLGDFYFCYTLATELNTYLEKTFPNASIRHSGATNVWLFQNQHSLKQHNLFLNIQHQQLELMASNEKGFCYYNVFCYETNEDVLYYLLFMMEQYGINPLHAKLAVSAQRDVTDELLQSIQKYISKLSYCVHDTSLQLNNDFVKLPQHYYFTLLNQHLCEL